MRLHFSTKHMHVGITFREELILDEEIEHIDNTGGEFEPVPSEPVFEDGFGFSPLASRVDGGYRKPASPAGDNA